MSVDFSNLTECPNCGLEFNKPKNNYNFCSYTCYQEFRDKQAVKEKIPQEVITKWWIRNSIYTHLWHIGYRPSLNWKRLEDEAEQWDEFTRLMWRDA